MLILEKFINKYHQIWITDDVKDKGTNQTRSGG
jgi:hypothetical protein